MTPQVKECGRCGSKIVWTQHSAPVRQQFYRELGGGKHDVDDIQLCSMCLDDVWEFVFDTDIDRSEKADPIPLDRLAGNVERHIEDLETILADLKGVNND